MRPIVTAHFVGEAGAWNPDGQKAPRIALVDDTVPVLKNVVEGEFDRGLALFHLGLSIYRMQHRHPQKHVKGQQCDAEDSGSAEQKKDRDPEHPAQIVKKRHR